jgi:hypothetical protein
VFFECESLTVVHQRVDQRVHGAPFEGRHIEAAKLTVNAQNGRFARRDVHIGRALLKRERQEVNHVERHAGGHRDRIS